VSAVDLPPGIGLSGTPLAVFRAPRRARRLAYASVVSVLGFGALAWYLALQRPWGFGTSKQLQLVAPVALAVFAGIGIAVRSATLAISRDGVRWGWTTLGFTQNTSTVARASIYRDGITLESKRGTWWFLAARDWDRFDALVRHVRRTEMTIAEHDRKAPIRARLQSYGRFLDAMLIAAGLGTLAIALWAA
jgi:hypothetical protein